MIKLNFKVEGGNPETPFNQEILEARIIELRRPVFDSLFSELFCDDSHHENFQNVITVTLQLKDDEIQSHSTFFIDKICCQSFEKKIKKSMNP
jgi:hypothetical protein